MPKTLRGESRSSPSFFQYMGLFLLLALLAHCTKVSSRSETNRSLDTQRPQGNAEGFMGAVSYYWVAPGYECDLPDNGGRIPSYKGAISVFEDTGEAYLRSDLCGNTSAKIETDQIARSALNRKYIGYVTNGEAYERHETPPVTIPDPTTWYPETWCVNPAHSIDVLIQAQGSFGDNAPRLATFVHPGFTPPPWQVTRQLVPTDALRYFAHNFDLQISGVSAPAYVQHGYPSTVQLHYQTANVNDTMTCFGLRHEQ